MLEIKMDEAGYEVYYSLDEAVKAFSHNIALENASLDLDIGLILESDVEPFSDYGMEAIGERVKEMASKAKSNFVLYAKKFINFFFGWLINFFRGVVKIKQSMQKNYQKAQKYVKALNKYEMQARKSTDKTIDITNASNIVSYGLTMTQIIKHAIKTMSNAFNDQNQGIKDLNQDKNNQDFNKDLHKVEAATFAAFNLCKVIASLPLNNGGKLESVLSKYNYNISKLIEDLGKIKTDDAGFESEEKTNKFDNSNDYDEPSFNGSSRSNTSNSNNRNNNNNTGNSGASDKTKTNDNGGTNKNDTSSNRSNSKSSANENSAKGSNTNYINVSKNGLEKRAEAIEPEIVDESNVPAKRNAGNRRSIDNIMDAEVVETKINGKKRGQISMSSYDLAFESDTDDEVKKATAHINNISRFLNNPERRELKCPDAWDYLRSQLILFINIAKNNKWDFENDIKKVELARRDLIRTLDGLNVEKKNDDFVKKYLKNVVDAGNNIAKLQNAANSAVRNVNKALDMMMTDVTKLGSMLTTIGGEPPKDKDAE